MPGDVAVQYYKRKGLIYEAKVSWLEPNYEKRELVKVTIIRTLGFVSYHLIRWIHGNEKLLQMASDIPEEYK